MSVQIQELEEILRKEEELLSALKINIDNDERERSSVKKKVLNYSREAKFFKDKLEQCDVSLLKQRLDDLEVQKIGMKRQQLEGLQKALKKFGDLEPTNVSLRRRIDELKKSRLSLELSFIN